MKDAWPEELAFLIEIFENRDSMGSYTRDGRDYEVPLLSAVQDAIDGDRLIKVPEGL